MSTPCFGEDAVHAIRSGLKALTPDLATVLISETRTQTCVQVALATVLVYTTFMNMDKEIKYFWSCPGKLVSLIYFATRYMGILSAMSNFAYTDMLHEDFAACASTTWLATITAWISMSLVDYILLMRVNALYNRDRRLVVLLNVFFVLEAIVRLVLQLYINATVETSIIHISPDFGICDKKNSPAPVIYIMRWIMPTIYGLVLLVLAVYKATQYWSISAAATRYGLLSVLIVDQGGYYISVIVCCVFRILTEQEIIKDWLALNLLSYFGSPIFLTVLGSQMLLRLKEVGDRESAVPGHSFDGPSAAAYDTWSSATVSADPQIDHGNKEKFVGININKSWNDGPSTGSNSFI